MTDRYAGFTVVLQEDIREDDAEFLLTALRMLKGVLEVRPIDSEFPNGMISEIRECRRIRDLMEKAMGDIFGGYRS